MKTFLCLMIAMVLVGISAAEAAETPSSVVHVVTLRWKDGTTDAQIKEVTDSLKAASATFPGMTRIWVRPIKVQGPPIGNCPDAKPINHVIVMEFANEAALKSYAGSEAQKEWYKKYIPLRLESRTHDITN